MLQCSPSQPGWQMQVPSWHWPCSSQRGWHALWSHAAPIQPSSHWQRPSEQTPWLPHGTGHSSAEQVGGDTREKEACKRECKREQEGGEQMEELSVGREEKVIEAQGTLRREKRIWGELSDIGERKKTSNKRG